MKPLAGCFLGAACWLAGSGALAQTPEPGIHPSAWKSVEKILGRAGMEQGDMLKVTFPRTDLNVTVNGIPVEPELALTSWFAFKPLGKGVMVKGEFVLLDQEVPKVTAQLKKRAFQVSEVQTHLLNESPGVKYLYMEGRGSRVTMAQAVNFILAFTGTPQKILETPTPGATPGPVFEKDWTSVQAILGPGRLIGKVLQYEFPAAEAITVAGNEISPYMGFSSSLHFQKVRGMALGKKGPLGLSIGSKTSKEVVAAAGCFLVSPAEIEVMLETLKDSHIKVTSNQPAFFDKSAGYHFLYFWAQGSPEEVASDLKAALGKIRPTKMK